MPSRHLKIKLACLNMNKNKLALAVHGRHKKLGKSSKYATISVLSWVHVHKFNTSLLLSTSKKILKHLEKISL
jgi:hypothetical protein